MWLQLKNNLESSSAECIANQLVTVTILLVSSNFEIREEALDGLVETDSMLEKFVAFEIIFEVRRRESVPVHHTLFYFDLNGRKAIRKSLAATPLALTPAFSAKYARR